MDQWMGMIWEVTKYVCGCCKEEADYIYNLEDNVESLGQKWKNLQDMKADVEAQVEEAENTGEMQRNQQVQGWFQQIQAIQEETEDTIVQGDQQIQNKCLYQRCPKNCVSSYMLGKKVSKLLKSVDDLVSNGKKFCTNVEIARKLPRGLVEMPIDETVGLGLMVEKVWNSIEEKDVGVIGLYGMGGAGKTTLLKKINNVVANRQPNFDVVIWVVVSKELNFDSIMDNIRKKIGIGDHIWGRCNKDEKAIEIYQVLKRKKFLLLLDDIWERVNLEMIGVPNPKDTNVQSKVIFTTRYEDVCYKMQAQRKFKVECLTKKEAFELFCMKVGEETLQSHPGILELAKDMAAKCKGLPLALKVVGSAMAGVKSLEAWKHSKNNLTNSSWTASDLETEVFSILKFSYDRLPDETHKKCFLYCSLYPEDYEIRVFDLIEKWVWEGFLGKEVTNSSIRDIHNYGESVLEKLKRSCLLECVKDDLFFDRTIKMHDMIRDMALWLLRDEDKNKRKIIVLETAFIKPEVHMPSFESSSDILTLMFEDNITYKKTLDLSNVIYLRRLKVLSVSCLWTTTIKIPAEIGDLVDLDYLYVSGGIEEFPMQLKNLRNLKYFALHVYAGDLRSISLEMIANFKKLRVLRFTSNAKARSVEEREFLEMVESLQHIEDLWIRIRSKNGLIKLLESTKLKTCVSCLDLENVDTSIDMPSLLASMSKMKDLHRIHFSSLEFIEDSHRVCGTFYSPSMLQELHIFHCNTIIHLTWLKYIPLLQDLRIGGCMSLEEVIKGGRENMDQNIFSSLVNLVLENLPKLESIHNTPLCFSSSLRTILIRDCPRLKKLPFDSNTAFHELREIRGTNRWWNNLEWEDPTIKHQLESKFRFYHKHGQEEALIEAFEQDALSRGISFSDIDYSGFL